MNINYFGLSCFKIVAKSEGRGSDSVSIMFAPYSKKLGLRPIQSSADIVLIPHEDEMFSGLDNVRGESVVIDKPGEFAVKGVNIVGLDSPADPKDGELRGNSVVFSLDVEDMKIVYLGAIGMEPTGKVLDLIGEADILFLPIGDLAGLDGKTAEVIARKTEPKMIIPMQFNFDKINLKNLRDEKDFCSNIGSCPKDVLDKLVVKKKDLENVAMEVKMLSVS